MGYTARLLTMADRGPIPDWLMEFLRENDVAAAYTSEGDTGVIIYDLVMLREELSGDAADSVEIGGELVPLSDLPPVPGEVLRWLQGQEEAKVHWLWVSW